MNKTDQQKNGKYIDYWKPAGIDAIAANDHMKVKKVIGNYTMEVCPTIYNTKIEVPQPKMLIPKKSKAERFKDLPFSSKHNVLVAGLYSSRNVLKQQAQKAAHEKKITDLIYKLRVYKLEREKRYKTNKPNLLVVQRENNKGLPYDFHLIPSFKKTPELVNVAKEMNKKLSKSMQDYFGLTIWKTDDYINDRIKKTPIHNFVKLVA